MGEELFREGLPCSHKLYSLATKFNNNIILYSLVNSLLLGKNVPVYIFYYFYGHTV